MKNYVWAIVSWSFINETDFFSGYQQRRILRKLHFSAWKVKKRILGSTDENWFFGINFPQHKLKPEALKGDSFWLESKIGYKQDSKWAPFSISCCWISQIREDRRVQQIAKDAVDHLFQLMITFNDLSAIFLVHQTAKESPEYPCKIFRQPKWSKDWSIRCRSLRVGCLFIAEGAKALFAGFFLFRLNGFPLGEQEIHRQCSTNCSHDTSCWRNSTRQQPARMAKWMRWIAKIPDLMAGTKRFNTIPVGM